MPTSMTLLELLIIGGNFDDLLGRMVSSAHPLLCGLRVIICIPYLEKVFPTKMKLRSLFSVVRRYSAIY